MGIRIGIGGLKIGGLVISNWNPPFKSDALFGLDGTIITVGADKYFKDKLGIRDFLITGYDFDSTWTKGFPYKSAATISAPAGDAVLIAADINNFLYDSGGTPNQLPVVSLFQDIDYEHKIFFKHVAQVVDGNGVETYEPRVLEVVMYASVKAGADLTTCQTYFGVPVESGTAKWADYVNGDDTSGTGTKINPVKTILKATTLGDVVYVKTGTYLENGSYGTVWLTAGKKVTGLSYCIINTPGADGFSFYGAGIEVKGLICIGKISGTSEFAGIVISNCLFDSVTSGLVPFNPLRGCTMNNVIIKSAVWGLNTVASAFKVQLNGCLVPEATQSLHSDGGSGYELEVNHCKLYGSASAIGWKGEQNVKIFDSILESPYAPILPDTASGNLDMSHCLLKKGSLITNFLDTTGHLFGTVNIQNNKFESLIDTSIILSNIESLTFKNNLLTSMGVDKNIGIQITTVIIPTVLDVSNNLSTWRGATPTPPLIIGSELGNGYNLMSGNVYNNKLIGNLYYDPLVAQDQHVLPVFNQNKIKVYNNYIMGAAIGILFKHSGADLTLCNCFGNILVNCVAPILVKGGQKLKIYGNTIYNKGIIGAQIQLIDNVADPSSDCVIKNNILFDDTAALSGGLCYSFSGTETGIVVDNNILFSTNNKLSNKGDGGLAAWRALGYDVNGINQNPLLTDIVNFIMSLQAGSPAIDAAETLDAAYDDGLDGSTNWGTDSQLPVVVTKQQGAVWDIGAYVHS